MRFFFLASLLFLAAGCRVVTPGYHLPAGYSETYRQKLLESEYPVVGPVEGVIVLEAAPELISPTASAAFTVPAGIERRILSTPAAK